MTTDGVVDLGEASAVTASGSFRGWTRTAAVSGLVLIAILVAAVLGLSAARSGSPPVRADAAGLRAQAWVLPGGRLVPFLRAQGIIAEPAPTSDTVVVARVSWTGRPRVGNARYTVLLGDARGAAGVIFAAYGPPTHTVSLGSASMWDATTWRAPWLAGDGPVRNTNGDWTSYGQFASVPARWTGDVWVVAHVVDVVAADPGSYPSFVQAPQPVVGVALSTDDHVWWLRRLT